MGFYAVFRVIVTLSVLALAFAFLFQGQSMSQEAGPGMRYVSRDIPDGTVAPGGRVSITLNIGVLSGDRFYLIDEVIPSGWTIYSSGSLVDAGTVNASEAGHLKTVVTSGVSDTSYTYTIKAPSTTGTHVFSGTYQIDGMDDPQNMDGESSITVEIGGSQNLGQPQSPGNNGDTGSPTNTASPGSPGDLDSQSQCPEGGITYTCICQGIVKSSGYCCSNGYQTLPCGSGQGPMAVLSECNETDTKPCGSNIGACSYGIRHCENGIWGECVGGAIPSFETYDGIDNDCDGETDEGCSFLDRALCTTGDADCICSELPSTEGQIFGISTMLPAEPTKWVAYFAVFFAIIFTTSTAVVVRRRHKKHDEDLMTMREAELMAMKGAVKS